MSRISTKLALVSDGYTLLEVLPLLKTVHL